MYSKKILIFGSTGLIGSACKHYFLKHRFTQLLTPARRELDLLDGDAVSQYMGNHHPNIVILAAGMVGGIQFNKSHPADFITTNLKIQLNTMSAAMEKGVDKFVFFGSSCMYPQICSQPMNEDHLFTGWLEPTSKAYATAKLAGIEMCLAYNKQYGKQIFIPLIPNTVYGPNDNFNPETGHVIPALIKRMHDSKKAKQPEITLWGTGEPRREFIHSTDVASAVAFLLSQDQLPEQPINVGTNMDIAIHELANLLKGIIQYPGKIHWDTTKPDGAPKKLLNSDSLFNMGWRPTIELHQGLGELYQWYQQREKNYAEI